MTKPYNDTAFAGLHGPATGDASVLQRMVARRMERVVARTAEDEDWGRIIQLVLPPARSAVA